MVWISVAILFVLFSMQRFGTDKVGYTFAPVISVWFLLIAGIGMYNLTVHEITILRAFNPKYIVDYFRRNGKEAWVSLGGVVLCITGELGITEHCTIAKEKSTEQEGELILRICEMSQARRPCLLTSAISTSGQFR